MCIRDRHSRYLYTQAINGAYGDIQDYEHHELWTPWYEDKTEVSNEGLVQLLLEKGILTDAEVEEGLVLTCQSRISSSHIEISYDDI